MKTIEEFLSYLGNLDIKLWADGDRLRCNAPEGTLTLTLRTQIQERKAEILPFLQKAHLASSSTFEVIQSVPREGKLPLSFAQQRLWFLDQLEPNSALYNIPVAVRLQGQLNILALEQSLKEVIRRHEILRTNFIKVDGQPVAIIQPESVWQLSVFDCEDLPTTEQHQHWQELATQQAQQPFDLATEPLVRATLLVLSETEHILLLIMHHIISDGWSIGVVVSELATLYEAFCIGQLSPLAELPIQYADFAAWQRQWLQGDVLEAQLTYWQQQLANAPALLSLPTDRPRPAVQTFQGASQSFVLSVELIAALNLLSQEAGVTLFMTLLAAFDTLLYRYTGTEDILVGSPIANRNRSELAGLIGFFVNTLVFRADISGNPSFRELLGRVQKTAMDAYAHQDLPFEMLVEALHPQRNLSHTPVFQVMFVLQNAPMPKMELPGLTLSPLAVESLTAKFDLTLTMENTPNGFVGSWEYNTDIFDATTIERMTGHFQTLLAGIVANPKVPVSQLPLLTEIERYQLLHKWNDTQRDYPQDKCIHNLFEDQVERSPDAIAVVFEEQQLTYRELNQRANQLAQHLQKLGVGPEVLVGICIERSLLMVIGLLGILKAGGAYVPIDPDHPQQRLTFFLQDCQTRILLTQNKFKQALSSHEIQLICLDSEWATIAQERSDNPVTGIASHNLAYVIYTSGSTGVPKGAMNTHVGVCNRLLWMQDTYQLTQADRILQKTPLSFDVSVWEFFWPLFTGACLVVAQPGVHRDSAYLVKLIAEQKITTIHFVPSMLAIFLEEQRLETCNCLKRVICSGEALSFNLQQRFFAHLGAELHNLYGPTEAAIDVTAWTCDRASTRQEVLIGSPIANMQMYVLDNQQCLVPVGIPGELYIGGIGLARGYYNRPELTAEKFIPHPFSQEPGKRLYKTGDIGRYRPDGTIEYLGRIDNQVKIRGFRIELGEIESVLSQHANVQEALVIARQDTPNTQSLVAYFVPSHKQTLTISELRQFLKRQLPEYMVPSAFVMLETLPLTLNGKVDRRALPVPESYRELEIGFVAPRTPIEEILALIWADVLRVEEVGIHDNFFELGGHSLLATQLVSRVRTTFGLEVPLRSLFEAATVADFAQYIQQRQQEKSELLAPPLLPTARDAGLPLSFAQKRLWFLDQLEPNSNFYNIPAVVRFQGKLNPTALEESLKEVIRRHETLRTNFITVDGQPVAIIQPESTWRLSVVDWRHLPTSEQQISWQELATKQAQQPFDLATESLIRGTLLVLSETEHILLLTMHHIVSDGWSIGVLVSELATLYQGFCSGQPLSLPELPIQYADFAAWQRQWLQGDVLESQLAYWRKHLSGAPTVLELPCDRPRPAVQTFRGATHALKLSQELSIALKNLSQQQQSTLFMTLLAVFKTLLYRYTGSTDIVVGTPIANRNRTEIEGLIGFFVNTLVLRTDISGNPTFEEILRRVREVALGAYAHQDLPFELLVETLQPQRNLSHSPLFQVMFVLQNAPMSALELPGLTLSFLEDNSDTAKFDLTLYMEETTAGMIGTLEYNTDLFDASTIQRMAEHLQTLLAGIVANPQQQISQLPLLTAFEQQQLLVEWNDTQVDYPQDKCIHQLFEEQVERSPDAIAVVFEDQHLTYRELNQRANQLAHHLQKLGVGPEILVGICIERSLLMVIGLLGILKAGGAYVPIDPAYPQERLTFFLQDCQTRILLTQDKFKQTLCSHEIQLICLDNEWTTIAQEPSDNTVTGIASHNLAYVIYTSGSTGKPKGVLVNHSNVVRLFAATNSWYNFNAEDVWTLFHSYAFDFSVWEIWGALFYGGRLVVVPYLVTRSPESFYKLLCQEQVTILNQTPSAFRQLIQAEQSIATIGELKLRLVIFGGEALEPKSLQPWFESHGDQSPQLVNMYGITETTVHVTYRPLSKTDLHGTASVIGRPIPDLQVYVLDEYKKPVPIGVPGEMYVGGAGVARGYLNRSELTQQRFISHPFSQEPGKRLYKTGDIGRYRPDGTIEYLGRIDNQVKIRGFRIELGEIEALLSQHPALRETVVTNQQDIRGEQCLVAYVVAKEQPAPSTSELRRFLSEKLPEYMIPAVFVPLLRLPLTPNGKLDHRALPAPDTARPELDKAFVAPRTPIEEVIAGIWTQVLGLEQVGSNDNFFELGGHSLLATQVISRLRDAFQVELPLRYLFESPTIAELAQRIEKLMKAGQGLKELPIQPCSRETNLPLSFAQQRLWFIDQLEPGSSLYNDTIAVRLTGTLNIAALAQSLNEIVQRHEALRTTFTTVDGQPVQVITPVLRLSLPIVDLRSRSVSFRESLPPNKQQIEIERFATEELQRPFNLAEGPLLRVMLLELDKNEHVLLFTIHHIVSDAWSLGLLVQEATTLYEAFNRGRPSPLPELPIQYADFAYWQQQWLVGEVLEAQLSYWQRHLSGAPTMLKLPMARPRPTVQTFGLGSTNFVIPKALTEEIKTLSRQEGVTLFMTLLATLQTLLSRYTHQEDIVVGTDVANRNRSNTEQLIGFFVNLLVLRTDLSGNPSFRELLRRVREVALGAYAHQDLPFAKLVDALQPERKLGHTPLFQILFVLQNTPNPTVELSELTLTLMEINTGMARFDLALFVTETEQGLIGTWKYSTDLFDADSITRMSGHFETLLKNIVAQPDTRINSLEMLTEPEKKHQSLEQKQRQAAKLSKFKTVKPKAVSLPSGELIKTDFLHSENTLPLVIQPDVADIELADWAKSHRDFIETQLLKHGAILFRNFNINSVSEFENVAGAICPNLFGEYGDLPREGVGGKVYGSTPYPNDKAILFHNESSHLQQWPMKIWFFCVQPAQIGGETPIVDCRKIYQLLNPKLRERFADKKLMYVRNFTEGLDVSWQEFFRTTEKAVVEDYCRQAGMDFEWSDNSLRTRSYRQAIAKHPRTDELVFFNQLQLHHISYLDSEIQNSLLSLFGEQRLPRHVYYGDGSPIEQSVIQEISEIYQQSQVSFTWQKGDIIMLDNMLAAHGRNPFVGSRKIVVAMGEMINFEKLAKL
ncbi:MULTISPECIES: non-ribosomal peptide synthetase [Nostoc]|uniref:Amino acid adenylation domain-containing protein n=2 Tax=Nostoc TaxID=1177 RepID=A0ABR8I0X5_9NOSO|nr:MULTISPECIES: non-ribosomal peptide synthetase [Nostoc]MBD2559795.1 amino acid adenylation domain-containing protein [Nostoc linckia FACHB-391]MBD2645241.1 amino acid adenylation domain-containing protein [Nostoc foliaceum FACHB-393]